MTIKILSKPKDTPTPEIFSKPKIDVKLSYLPPPPKDPIWILSVTTSKMEPV